MFFFVTEGRLFAPTSGVYHIKIIMAITMNTVYFDIIHMNKLIKM